MEGERAMEIAEDRTVFSLIPLDLTIEILLRLPAKSIGRFRCVSKLWSSMTTTPHFVKSFAVYSLGRPCLLSVKEEEDERLFVYSVPHHHDDQNRAEKHQMMLAKEVTCLPLTEHNTWMNSSVPQSVQGLISIGDFESVIIWNPTLREYVTLPENKVSKPLISLFGYDPVGGEYKVLSMSLCEDARKNGEEAQIFTVGAQESWRRIQNSTSLIHPDMNSWRCIKGVVYYFSADGNVVSFDVRSEKFEVIQTPKMVSHLVQLMGLGGGFLSHVGRLAWFFNDTSLTGGLKLWVLEDGEWSQERSILPFETLKLECWNGKLRVCSLILSGETADDELIYLPTSSEGPLSAIYYHLKRGSVRKVEYDGIDGKNFRFNCFPHHIESLMSLNNLLAGP